MPTINPLQRMQSGRRPRRTGCGCAGGWGPSARETWKNLAELDRIVTEQLAPGRAATAAAILEKAYPAAKAPWDVLDRIATLRLHLGEPEKARASGGGASSVPNPRSATHGSGQPIWPRSSSTRPEGPMSRPLPPQPDLFEARYGLAVLEQDAGRATAAYEQRTRGDRVGSERRRPRVGPRHRFGRRPICTQGKQPARHPERTPAARPTLMRFEMVLRSRIQVRPVRLPFSWKAFRGRSSNRCATT